MTRTEKALFSLLRVKVGNYIEKYLEDDQGHKSYEGTWELMVTYPSYFESDDFTAPPDLYCVKLHCYVLGPRRHYEWVGGSWIESLKKAKSDIENWIMDEHLSRCSEEYLRTTAIYENEEAEEDVLIKALEKNTEKIVKKANDCYAEYRKYLQEKAKTLEGKLASLRNEADTGIEGR